MKDVKGYDKVFAVTRDGRVWCYPRKWTRVRYGKIQHYHHNGKYLKTHLDQRGYPRLQLKLLGGEKIKNFRIHRLVAMAYLPNPLNLPQINHKNGIKTDNRVENLEWCTNRENYDHAVKNGLKRVVRGEQHGMSKLTEKKVIEIRKIYRSRVVPRAQLAKKYKVSRSTIDKVLSREDWKHI